MFELAEHQVEKVELRALIFEEFLKEETPFFEIFGVIENFFGEVTQENFAALLKHIDGELVTILGLGSLLSHSGIEPSLRGKRNRTRFDIDAKSEAVDPSEWDMVHKSVRDSPCFSKTTRIVSTDHQGCGEMTRRMR